MLTERDHSILLALGRYSLLDRRRVQALCFPTDAKGRVTRRRLQMLCRGGYVRRTRLEVVNPRDGMPAPAYFLTKRGTELLAERSGDDRYFSLPTTLPQPLYLHHALAVADTHIALDQAIAAQPADQEQVELVRWINEHDKLNPEEPDPRKHVRLFTELRASPRKLVFAPDAAFALRYAGHVGVFYLEQDRCTTGSKQVAARKAPGAAEFAQRQSHRKHFPETTLDRFTILCIAPTPGRRDALRRAFRGKEGAELWRLAALGDLRSDTMLFAHHWYSADQATAMPLVRRTSAATVDAQISPTCRWTMFRDNTSRLGSQINADTARSH